MEKNQDFEKMLADALAKQEAEFNKKLQQREENVITLGASCSELIEIVGKEILDRETKQPLVNENGEIRTYPNQYKAKFSFNGGEIETPIKLLDFINLKIGVRYLLSGRLGEVKEFGQTSIKPIFTQFVQI